MRAQILCAVLASTVLSFETRAQDSYFADESLLAATQPLVIAGTTKGKCTPEMPMLKASVTYSVQLQATADKTFVLDSHDLNFHMEAKPGTTRTVLLSFKKGDYGFTCGDKNIPEQSRTQGMFMAM